MGFGFLCEANLLSSVKQCKDDVCRVPAQLRPDSSEDNKRGRVWSGEEAYSVLLS